jgi:hypothetical protein
MYRIINENIGAVLEAVDPRFFLEYSWLIDHRQGLALTDEYQRRYKSYWGMGAARLPNGFHARYFDELANRRNQIPNPVTLARELAHFTHPRSLQVSFCTKLCHMLNQHLPIIDGLIMDFYFWRTPNLDLDGRANYFRECYQFLIKEYQRILAMGLLNGPIAEIRRAFPLPVGVKDERVVDALIWHTVRVLRDRGLVSGIVVYRG